VTGHTDRTSRSEKPGLATEESSDRDAHGAADSAEKHEGHDAGSGHGGGHADHADMFRMAFWRNLALAIPVLIFSYRSRIG
jgi:hypothetical protein